MRYTVSVKTENASGKKVSNHFDQDAAQVARLRERLRAKAPQGSTVEIRVKKEH